MRLLLDQNLSPYLVGALRDLYPDSTHVRDVNLASADDEVVWNFAAQQGLSIVSKDSDFRQRSFVRGHPLRGRPSDAAAPSPRALGDPIELWAADDRLLDVGRWEGSWWSTSSGGG